MNKLDLDIYKITIEWDDSEEPTVKITLWVI